jgi:hypothetical protein
MNLSITLKRTDTVGQPFWLTVTDGRRTWAGGLKPSPYYDMVYNGGPAQYDATRERMSVCWDGDVYFYRITAEDQFVLTELIRRPSPPRKLCTDCGGDWMATEPNLTCYCLKK